MLSHPPELTRESYSGALQERGRVEKIVGAEHVRRNKRDLVLESELHEAHPRLEVQSLFPELSQDLWRIPIAVHDLKLRGVKT